jgi:hypothetical protein
MSLQKLPTVGLDDINHRKRARETINKILDHSFDDSRVQTSDEKLAGVTPVNYAYPPGDVRRYGATGDGVTDDTVAIQRALDVIEVLGGTVFFPKGTYKVTSTLRFGSGCCVRGVGYDSLIQATFDGPIWQSKGGTSTRRFRFSMYDMGIDCTSKATYPLSIAISLRNANRCNLQNIHIANCGDGVEILADTGLTAYYNTLTHVEISDADMGFRTSTGGNEAQLFGCRTNFCVEGMRIEDNTGVSVYATAFENFTTGVKVQSQAYNACLHAIRVENAGAFSGTGTGISISANSEYTMVDNPDYVTLGTNITDSSTSTLYRAPDGWYFNGGSKISKHQHFTLTHDVASLAAGAFRQEGALTVTGVQVGDAVSVSLPASWPNNIIVGVPIVTATNQLYLPMYNPSGAAVDPASGDFQFTWDHH